MVMFTLNANTLSLTFTLMYTQTHTVQDPLCVQDRVAISVPNIHLSAY